MRGFKRARWQISTHKFDVIRDDDDKRRIPNTVIIDGSTGDGKQQGNILRELLHNFVKNTTFSSGFQSDEGHVMNMIR